MTRPQFKKRLNPAVGNYPPSLVRSWLWTYALADKSKAEALRDLNQATGKKYSQGKLYDWLTLKREPERETRIYMLRVTLPNLLARHHNLKPQGRQLEVMAEELS